VDLLAGDGPRGDGLLRELSSLLHRHRSRLCLAALEDLGLVDVVLTFRIRAGLSLVATGRHPEHPGEVTVRFSEEELPRVGVWLEPEERAQPYEICVLDSREEGRPVALATERVVAGLRLPAGARGRLIADTTVGESRHLRVALDALPGLAINLPPEALVRPDEVDLSAVIGGLDSGREDASIEVGSQEQQP
jgi:hypothetical protein